jgi:predicted metal-dependent phosphoesterase TrpH
MPDFVDLHIHSSHSDGRQSPQQVVDVALGMGLKAISITDHDVVSGYLEAAEYARGKSIDVIAGIELSASKKDDDIHLLGYLIRPDHEGLLKALERFRRIRNERGKKMVKRLADIGVKIEYEDVLQSAGNAALGRPHLAEALAKNGIVASYNEAFNKYLALDGPVYVPKAKLTPTEAIDLIHQAGGMAAMAHPALTNRDDMIEEMAAAGLDGMEVFHPTHGRAARKKYRQIARHYKLFITGGSDSHNRKGRYGHIGQENVPYGCYEKLMKTWQKRADRR